jgi:two-component system, NarL family, sensor histidine kinase DegS
MVRSSRRQEGRWRSGERQSIICLVNKSDRLRDLQILAILVPALCAGIYETLRHSVLPGDLPYDLGTPMAVVIVLAISFGFAKVSFGMIRHTEARLRQRNRELQALSRRVERLAVLEERDRLAREIHDSVAQGLASLLVRLDTVESLAERGRVDELALEFRALRTAGAEIYGDVREAIAELRTRPDPGPVGLRRALTEYVTQFGDRTGIATTCDAASINAAEQDLAPAAEVQLLRIAQEALTNVRKHASAAHAVVRFWREAGGWYVTVRDDGVGFDPTGVGADAGGRHVGLTIMRERAESVGGRLAVNSAPGEGTEVSVWVPGRAATAASEEDATLINATDRREPLRGASTPASS